MTTENKNRLLELLAEQTIFGLDEQDLMELEKLKIQFPDWRSFDNIEAAAAAISLSNLQIVPLPNSLRTKILADADEYFTPAEKMQQVRSFDRSGDKGYVSNTLETAGNNFGSSSKRPFWQWLGWGVAAAACALLVANLWLTRFQPAPQIAENPKSVQTPVPQLSAAEQREQLLAAAPDAVRSKLEPPKGASNISGEVVWSNELQKGYVTFRGLPANDPNKETYQLWIVDEARDPKTPVDGGIFDVRENGEIVVPIEVKLQIKKPKLFAVTEEKPGGVVVSKLDKLVATAKI